LSQLLRSVLACRASPARPFNYLVFGCPAFSPARIVCPRLLLCYGHLSAIPGQRSTDSYARSQGAWQRSRTGIAPQRLSSCPVRNLFPLKAFHQAIAKPR
jgi:hypothetical protein